MKCSSVIVIATLAIILIGFGKVSDARRHLISRQSAGSDRNLRILHRLLAAQIATGADKDPVETVPMTSQELNKILDELESHEISESCFLSEDCAKHFMFAYNYVYGKLSEAGAFLDYRFETNITEFNEKELNDFAPISNRFQSITKDKAYAFLKNDDGSKEKDKWDPELRRMLFLAAQGIVFKSQDDVVKLANLTSQLESIFATAKVCRPGKSDQCLSLEPHLTEIMQNSRDYDELLWVWSGWHNESGRKMRSIYTQTVEIQNKAARDNKYNDLSDFWIADFEDEKFEEKAAQLFDKIKPLYQKIHSYVRGKLDSVYGAHYPEWHNPELIPAHLLGNMWSQTWENILGLVKPYPDVEGPNVTQLLLDNKYTPIKMFQKAESFFTSIGLFEMTPEFWTYSMIEKPEGREVVCHASATDLYNSRDFRIKMCTTITGDQFNTIHHEMGHIEYYMAYEDQPAIFRTGANSAFHEAIGDTISLSVQTKKHLKSINMVDDDSLTEEQHINYLMEIALQKVVFLPFAYLMDNWRWNVFRGNINESNYNEKWWEMRQDLQGLEPPIKRSEADFDPGAKYHIAAYVPYARYFISHFLQFQFYSALCDYAKHSGPLHTCDFYQSKEAGLNLKKMLELGASKHWSYALEKFTGETEVSAEAILKYFQPLSDWLDKQNLKNSKLVM